MRQAISRPYFTLKKGGRFYTLCCLAIALTLCLSVFISAFFDSMVKTGKEGRASLYGAWHVAVYQSDNAIRRQMKQHALVAQAGEINIYGRALANEAPLGLWGTVDQSAAVMGQITLSCGRLPTGEGELAVEADKMEQLGWKNDRLGQSVTLAVQNNNESPPVLQTFRLVGVIDNYTQFWKEGVPYLPSFVVYAPMPGAQAVSTSLFCQLKEGSARYSRDILLLADGHGKSVFNDYTYNSHAPSVDGIGDNSTLLHQSVLQVICMAVLAFILYCLLLVSLKEREKSFSLMRSIGASGGRILRIYTVEMGMVTAIGLLAGTVCGCLFAPLIVAMAKTIYDQTLSFSLRPFSVFSNVAIVMATVFLTVCVTLLFFASIKRPSKPNCDRPVKKFRRKAGKRLGLVRMKSNFNRAHLKETVFSVILMCCICTGLTGTAYYAYEKYDTYNLLQENEPFDYMYGYEALLANQPATLPVAETQRLRSCYGVGQYLAYSHLPKLSAQWDAGMEQSYYAPLAEKGLQATQAGLFGLMGEWAGDLDQLQESGAFPVDTTLLTDSSVLIYLPDYCVTEENKVVYAGEQAFDLLKDIYPVHRENSIQPGTQLTLSGGSSSRRVTVAGVLRGFPPHSAWAKAAKPYTVFGSGELADDLAGSKAGQVHFIQLTALPAANHNQITEVLSGMFPGLGFSDIAAIKQDSLVRANFTMAVIVSLNMLFLLCFLMIWRGGVIALSATASRQRVQLLYILGMKRSALFMLHVWNTAVASVFAGVVALIVILLGKAHTYFAPLSYSEMSRAGPAAMWDILLGRFFQQVPWQVVVCILIGFVLMNFVRASAAFYHRQS